MLPEVGFFLSSLKVDPSHFCPDDRIFNKSLPSRKVLAVEHRYESLISRQGSRYFITISLLYSLSGPPVSVLPFKYLPYKSAVHTRWTILPTGGQYAWQLKQLQLNLGIIEESPGRNNA